MSFCIDVNILLYASDRHCAEYDRAAEFLTQCVDGSEVFCIAWLTAMSYLRMATHPKIFSSPLTHQEAVENIEALISMPHARVLSEREGFWAAYQELSATVLTRANLVPDVHLAAVLRVNGVRVLYTRDRDFLKFPSLDVRDPIGMM